MLINTGGDRSNACDGPYCPLLPLDLSIKALRAYHGPTNDVEPAVG